MLNDGPNNDNPIFCTDHCDEDLVDNYVWVLKNGKIVNRQGLSLAWAVAQRKLGWRCLDFRQPENWRIEHLNGDPADCSRSNLRVWWSVNRRS